MEQEVRRISNLKEREIASVHYPIQLLNAREGRLVNNAKLIFSLIESYLRVGFVTVIKLHLFTIQVGSVRRNGSREERSVDDPLSYGFGVIDSRFR